VSTPALFTGLVGLVLLALLAAVRTMMRRDASQAGVYAAIAAAIVVFWVVVPGALAWRGLLDRYSPLPPPALMLILALTAGTVALALTRFGAALAAAVPVGALVGYQVFRVPVELLLHRLYSEGVVPVQMTYSGRNLDIVTGLTAAAVAAAVYLRRCPRWLLASWNAIGLALLANIVAVAVLSTPVPFRYFMNEPANRLPDMFPYVWLPTFLVQAALFGHLVLFRALRATPANGRR
jgi:hypothetical protein